MTPIFEKLKKGNQFKFSEEAKVAFDRVKINRISNPLLNYSDFSRYLSIYCDASDLFFSRKMILDKSIPLPISRTS